MVVSDCVCVALVDCEVVSLELWLGDSEDDWLAELEPLCDAVCEIDCVLVAIIQPELK